jgi:hypothetical protein
MIDQKQIPPEVERAVTDLVLAGGFRLTPEEARAAIAAGLAAWPGMIQLAENDSASIREMAALILPLTQQASDE